MTESSIYQEIRAHLAYLRLGAAAARHCPASSTMPARKNSATPSSCTASSKSK